LSFDLQHAIVNHDSILCVKIIYKYLHHAGPGIFEFKRARAVWEPLVDGGPMARAMRLRAWRAGDRVIFPLKSLRAIGTKASPEPVVASPIPVTGTLVLRLLISRRPFAVSLLTANRPTVLEFAFAPPPPSSCSTSGHRTPPAQSSPPYYDFLTDNRQTEPVASDIRAEK